LFCDGLQSIYEDAMDGVRVFDKGAKAAFELGHVDRAKEFSEDATKAAEAADEAKQDGRTVGCSWAKA
jgi:hypothetical protein